MSITFNCFPDVSRLVSSKSKITRSTVTNYLINNYTDVSMVDVDTVIEHFNLSKCDVCGKYYHISELDTIGNGMIIEDGIIENYCESCESKVLQ